MDIHSYFRSASKSPVVSSSGYSVDSNESEINVQPNPPMKHCSSSTSKPTSKSGSGISRYSKKWVETFPWLELDGNYRVQIMQKWWMIKSFANWKKATQKMKLH